MLSYVTSNIVLWTREDLPEDVCLQNILQTSPVY